MTRLDVELVSRGLARSRAQARELIDAGRVTVNGTMAKKAAIAVHGDDQLAAQAERYVSRGAGKLLGALDDLHLSVIGARVLDAGASTGGFTQVLLERGAAVVYAVDVGTGQLAPALRGRSDVVSHEQTHLHDLRLAHLGDRPVDLVVADLSFISLTQVVDRFAEVVRPDGRMLLMVKPQFEVGRDRLPSDGVVRHLDLHRAALASVAEAARRHGWHLRAGAPSRVVGPAGNQEYFAVFTSSADSPVNLELMVESIVRPR